MLGVLDAASAAAAGLNGRFMTLLPSAIPPRVYWDGSVSYTHLDVYKRQVLNRPHHGDWVLDVSEFRNVEHPVAVA